MKKKEADFTFMVDVKEPISELIQAIVKKNHQRF